MKSVNFPSCNVYTMIDEKLQCVKVKSIKTDAECNVLSTTVVMPGGEERTFEGELHYFGDESLFKTNEEHLNTITPIFPMRCSDEHETKFIIRGWVMNAGEPQIVERDIEEIVINCCSGRKSEVKLSNDATTDGMYTTREECLDHSEYDVVHEDGTVEHRIGTAKLLELTPEQRKLVDELIAKLKEVKDAGIKAYFMHYYDKIYFVNANNVSNVDFCYEDPSFGEDKYEQVSDNCAQVENVKFFETEEDNNLYVQF